MSQSHIDINCDLGEGTGNESAIMPFISSVNIACGFHAGNASTMLDVVRLAKKHGVAVGAHPSYNDREHFGRRNMELSPKEIYALVLYQMGALYAICQAEGVPMHHVKPHGALYNQAATDSGLAEAIAKAVKDFDKKLIIYGLSGSQLITASRSAGLATAAEVFADRTYTSKGLLTSRTMPNALITDKTMAVSQVVKMIFENLVIATDGTAVPIDVETVCIHGDGLRAPEFANALHTALTTSNILIKAPS
jgi:5-oxoprolinase (ATP-hydrolysing) subunit A